MKKAKISAKIEARTYTAIMLTFGCLFELLNAIAGDVAAIATLSEAGWILIAVSVPLFILETLCHRRKH
jgi:vacuolar-type H+-ATPase subunit I/STV1